MKWDLDSAVKFIRELEPKLAALGAHCGLTGSILYVGQSLKDVDIIIYPHDKKPEGWDYNHILDFLRNNYGVLFKCATPYPNEYGSTPSDIPSQIKSAIEITEYRDSKDVYNLTLADGNRVDLFFLM